MPRTSFEETQLRFLIENNFMIRDIATMFGCSRCTIEQRLYNITVHNFVTLSDRELDGIVRFIVSVKQ